MTTLSGIAIQAIHFNLRVSSCFGKAYLFNGDSTGLRYQEQGEEDGNELPSSEEDIDTKFQGAQHVQERCTQHQPSFRINKYMATQNNTHAAATNAKEPVELGLATLSRRISPCDKQQRLLNAQSPRQVSDIELFWRATAGKMQAGASSEAGVLWVTVAPDTS